MLERGAATRSCRRAMPTVLVVDVDGASTCAGDVDRRPRPAAGVPTLGFFAHVEPEVRERALGGGLRPGRPALAHRREGADACLVA